jgi:hypothetical protein
MIGLIYRIIHLESEICYIGSTFNELRFRWQQHKGDYNKWVNGNNHELSIYPYFKQHHIGQFKMGLIKEYQVVDRTHLEAYEQLWINKFRKSCVNKTNPFCIKKLYFKQYQEANKENKIKYDKQYYLENKESKKESVRQYREANKDKIKAYKNQKFDCKCGGSYSQTNRSAHMKSKKHQNWQGTQ